MIWSLLVTTYDFFSFFLFFPFFFFFCPEWCLYPAWLLRGNFSSSLEVSAFGPASLIFLSASKLLYIQHFSQTRNLRPECHKWHIGLEYPVPPPSHHCEMSSWVHLCPRWCCHNQWVIGCAFYPWVTYSWGNECPTQGSRRWVPALGTLQQLTFHRFWKACFTFYGLGLCLILVFREVKSYFLFFVG